MAWDISKNGTPTPLCSWGVRAFFLNCLMGLHACLVHVPPNTNLEGFYAPNDPCWGHPLVWVWRWTLSHYMTRVLFFYSVLYKIWSIFPPKKSIISLICTIRTKISWYRWRIGSHVFLLKHSVRYCSWTTLEKSEEVFRSSN